MWHCDAKSNKELSWFTICRGFSHLASLSAKKHLIRPVATTKCPLLESLSPEFKRWIKECLVHTWRQPTHPHCTRLFWTLDCSLSNLGNLSTTFWECWMRNLITEEGWWRQHTHPPSSLHSLHLLFWALDWIFISPNIRYKMIYIPTLTALAFSGLWITR